MFYKQRGREIIRTLPVGHFLFYNGEFLEMALRKHLGYSDRKLIETLYMNGSSLQEIGDILSVHISTVYREISKGKTGAMDKNGRVGYSADLAQQKSLKLEGSR